MEVAEEETPTIRPNEPIWEWVAMSMVKKSDFVSLKEKLDENGIDKNQLNNAYYLGNRRKQSTVLLKRLLDRQDLMLKVWSCCHNIVRT